MLELATDTLIDGRYEVLGRLGGGGVGAVYRARDVKEGEEVALKLLDRAADREEVRRRFRREFHLLSRVQHPRVVRPRAWGIHGGRPYFAMDYLAGRTLAEAMGDGAEREALRGRWLLPLVRQVAEGLACIHEKGMVHRDLKPSNIMICEADGGDGIEVTILDLGLARFADADGPPLTREGVAMGTVEYMSPEQGRGGWVDGRSDLYSLGVILYEVLTGSPPFTGDSPVSVILKHIRERPLPPRSLNPAVQAPLQRVVLKLLEKEPIDRFQSAEDLLDAIREFEQGASETTEKAPAAPARATVFRPQFLGREGEMKALREMLEAVQGGARRTVVVSGEAGIGKSRVLEELQSDALLYGMLVLKGACYEEGGEAYGPLMEVLEGAGLNAAAVLAAGRSEDSMGGLPGQGAEDRYATIEALSDALKGMCRSMPALLCIEDVQWADDLTFQFLRYFQRDPDEVPLMVCLTCRQAANEPVPKRLEGLFQAVRREGGSHLRLACLEKQETGRLAASLLGEREVPEDAVEALYGETGGHPFFIEETVRTLVEAGAVRHDGAGGWQWDPVPETLMPEGVVDVLRKRLEAVIPEQRRALEYASVLKGTFPFDLLAAMWRGDDLDLLEVMEDLVAAGLLREVNGSKYRFAHALFQRAVYSGLRKQKRSLLHGKAGKALEAIYGEGGAEAVFDLAYHFSRSADADRAERYLCLAGKQALEADAFLTAVQMFEAASRAKKKRENVRSPSHEQFAQEMLFLCDYASALTGCRQYEEALEKAQEARALTENDRSSLRATVLACCGVKYSNLYRYREAEAELIEALQICRESKDDALERRILWPLVIVYDSIRRTDEAIKYSRLAAEKFRSLGGDLNEAMVFRYEAYTAFLENRFGDARMLLEREMKIWEKLKDKKNLYSCTAQLGRAAFYLGDFDLAAQMYNRCLANWKKRETRGTEAQGLTSLGEIALEAGDAAGALEYGKSAETILSEMGEELRVYQARALVAEALNAMGDTEQALEWIEKARPGTEVEGITCTIVWRRIGRVLASAGRYDEAEAAFEQAIVSEKVREGGFEWVRSLLAAGAFHLERGNRERARERLEQAKQRFERMQTAYFAQKAADLLQELSEQARHALSADRLGRFSQERLAVLTEVCGDLTALLDLDPLLDRLLERLLGVSRADRALVVLRDETSGALHTQVARSHNLEDAAAEEISRGVIREVIEGNAPVLSLDARADERFREYRSVVDYDIRSVVCVPLYHGREGVIGALYVDHRGLKNAFSEADLSFLSAFASLVASAVVNARMHTQLKERARYLQAQVQGRHRFGDLVGQSPAMQAVYRLLEQAAGTDATVLIRGETGTGKELAARAVHYNSARRERLFLSQNCGALSEDLLQSELFGHKRGAFTGAADDRKGLFEAADGGTIFLDEIGDASPQVQASLLRVLQEGEVRRVGESEPRKVDVRIVAATNRDLEAAVAEGRFREDLYYRLRVLQVDMPPLRERAEDIPLLAEHLLAQAAEGGGKRVSGFTRGAVQALMDYDWPGNVRELENEVRRVVALAEEGEEIGRELLSGSIVGEGEAEVQGDLKGYLEAVEKRFILDALAKCDGNITRAAERLGMTRSGLYKKISKYGIQ